MRASRLAIAAAIALWVSGCNSPTDPGHAGYEGQWNGTTAQGKAISFTISPDERVTAIAIAHEFNGCSGSQTFSGLNIDIAPQVQCIPGPCPSAITEYRAFGYTSGDRIEGPSTDIQGLFQSASRAAGTVNFRGYPECGSAVGVPWTAAKQ